MALALLIAGIVFNVFIFAVVLPNSRSKVTQYLTVIIAGLTFWEVANFLADQSGLFTLFWNRLAFIGPPFIMLASYYFVTSLRSVKRQQWMMWVLRFGTVAAMVLPLTPFIVTEVHSRVEDGMTSGYNPVYGTGYYIYILWIVVAIASFIYSVTARTSRESAQTKRQLKIIRWGTIAAIVIPVITNLILPNVLHASNSTQLLPLTSMIYVGALTLAIVRHGLLDIKTAAVRSVAYAFSIITLAAVYYVIAYFVSLVLFQDQENKGISVNPIFIAIALVLAFIFQPIKDFFDKVTDRIFYRDRYHTHEFYAHFSETLTSTTDLHELLRRASSEIGGTLKSRQTFFFIQYSQTRHVSVGTKRHADLPARDVKYLNEHVGQYDDKVLVTNFIDDDAHLQRLLISHRIALLMPLTKSGTTLGYMALGEHQGNGYTSRDIEVLRTVSDELAIAIQNALSLQEVRDLNAHLQQRIDTATAELRRSNARLRRLDTVKDEFLSMASHQLRTPLTSIKGYLSMVLEGDMGKVPERQRKVLEEAYVGSERMVHLIHDFLNVSRIQTGKFALEKQPIDFDKLITEEVASLARAASNRNIKLAFSNTAGDDISLTIDDTKMRQVVMNFIDNAIFYSRPNSQVNISLGKDKSIVEFKVADHGIGVPIGEQSQMFNKFYRASNARKLRPDGTGVGLYLSKKIVTAHGGELIFSSKEGKGSTFGFRLPLENDAK